MARDTFGIVLALTQLATTSVASSATLRRGVVVVTARTQGFNFDNVNNPIAIAPAAIASGTLTIGMTGTLRNAGFLNCSVTFRAPLLPVFDGP